MRIGFISDVHANLPALLAFLEGAKEERIERIYCAGDVVGYNPYPVEVVEIFIEEKIPTVAGNHDAGVCSNDFTNFNWAAEAAGRWTREKLGAKHLEFLSSLQPFLRFEYAGKKICICHGSPYDRDEYVYPENVTEELLFAADADILVLGHSHIQFCISFPEGIVLNPGSIGQPRDLDWRPGYAILDLKEGHVDVHLRRFEYPVEEVLKKFRETGLPEVLAQRLLVGR
ncbi:MAG: metallophosphoesterase family protein [Thermoplasmata archaeon]